MTSETLDQQKIYKISWVFFSIAILGVVSVLLWSFTGRLEESVMGAGQIVPEGKLRKIMAPTNGVITTVHVRENQTVKVGDLLVELNPDSAISHFQALQEQIAFLEREGEILRPALQDTNYLQMLSSLDASDIHEKWLKANLERMLAELEALQSQGQRAKHEMHKAVAELKRVEAMLKRSERQLEQHRDLFAKGGITEKEFSEFEQKVIDQRGQRLVLQQDLQARRYALQENVDRQHQTIATLREKLYERLSEQERQLVSLRGDLEKAKVELNHTVVRSPINATVHELSLRGKGEVARMGETLLSLVPSDSKLFAEIQITNQDLSYISLDQKAAMTIDAYPYQQFGRLNGRVVGISPYTAEQEAKGGAAAQEPPKFVVRLELEKQGFERNGILHKLRPGMTLSANLITREKLLIDYVTEPIRENIDKAFRDPSTRFR